MSKRESRLLLEDILESIGKIKDYTNDLSLNEFKKDSKTIDAVIRNLEIIGEAAIHLPEKIKSKTETIKWSRIIGLRNRVIHEYFGVDIEIIWKIITEDLLNLEKSINAMLE